ncbi:zinc finger protein ZFP2-like [Uranotaenia lowii]|uniref:zinc finger protein ZFP2-like n=1 Tax=Uranotaenia lowii TaxID=190385 RepID=UPI00247A5B2F|nr:zinc finger protein ZFP2-like [Uranotaenia lowii]
MATVFQDSWTLDDPFSVWVQRVENKPNYAACSFCEYEFALSNMGRQALVSHAKSKRHIQSVAYPPKISTPSFETNFIEAALMDSLRNVAEPMPVPKQRGRKKTIVTLDSIKKELSFECELCKKRFRKRADYFQHKQTHGEPLPCDMCSEVFFKPWDLNKHKAEKHNDAVVRECEVCSKTFIENWKLMRHMRTHTGEKNFECEECGKQFTESGNLTKHIKQVHSKDRPFVCEICDKSFPQKKDLQGHMLTHAEKRFSCKVCEIKFSLRSERSSHMRECHPSEAYPKEKAGKALTCSTCGEVFHAITKFSNHMLLHGERVMHCTACPKKFHTYARLQKHMRAHRAEEHSKCSICDKTFSQECNLKRHISGMHMKDGRYFCMCCPLMFDFPEELRAHREANHLNELEYKCTICEKAFATNQSFAIHKKRHAENPEHHLRQFVSEESLKLVKGSKLKIRKQVKRKPRVNKKSQQTEVLDSKLPIKKQIKRKPRVNKKLQKLKASNSNQDDLLVPLKGKRGRPRKIRPGAESEAKEDSRTPRIEETSGIATEVKHEPTESDVSSPVLEKPNAGITTAESLVSDIKIEAVQIN